MKNKEIVTIRNVLIITPDWPPAHCGVAGFSANLFNSLCRYFTCYKFVYSGALPNQISDIKSLIDVNGIDLVHIIFHNDHVIHSRFFDLTNNIRSANKRFKIIVSCIEFGDSDANPTSQIFFANSDGVIAYDKDTYLRCKKTGKPVIEMACGALFNDVSFDLEPKNFFDVAYWGFLNKNKGIETFIKAIPLISKELPIRFTVKGAIHEQIGDKHNVTIEYKQTLNTLVTELNDPRITFDCGFYTDTDLISFLGKIDCCVLPFVDGASNKRSSIFNSLSVGLSLITTKTSQTPEPFLNQPFVQFIDPHDNIELARKIEALYHTGLHKINKTEVVSFYKNNFSWDLLGDQIFIFYKKVALSRAPLYSRSL